MKILGFNNYIVEKLGVSKSSLQFVDLLTMRCRGDFEDFLNSKSNRLDHHVEKIPYGIIKNFMTDKSLYSEFPVVEFQIIYNFIKLTDTKFRSKYSSKEDLETFYVGGWAAGFGHRNWKWYSKIVEPKKISTERGIVIQIGVEIIINKDKFDYSDSQTNEKVTDDISSTFYHELNHSFEHYKRTLKSSEKKFIWERSFTTALTYAAVNRYKFPKNIYKFWEDNFLDYIYLSEDFELRSNVQEMAYFLKKYPDRELSDFVIFNRVNYMQDFDSDKFYEKLIKKIGENDSYKGEEIVIADRLKKMWCEVYLKECKDQGASPILSESTLNEMSCYDFIKYWAKKFNQNGTYLKKKIYKLKSGIEEI